MPSLKNTLIAFSSAAALFTGPAAMAEVGEGSVVGIYRDFGLIVRVSNDKDKTFPCHTHIVVDSRFTVPFNHKTCEPVGEVSAKHKQMLEEAFGPKQAGQARKILVDVPQDITIDNMQPGDCGMLTGKVRIANSSVTLASFLEKFGYKQSKTR